VRADVSNYIDVRAVDYVLHFASPASPVLPQDAIPTLKVGALGTHNALGLALVEKAKFFLASTANVTAIRNLSSARGHTGVTSTHRTSRRCTTKPNAMPNDDMAYIAFTAWNSHRPHLQHLWSSHRLNDGRALSQLRVSGVAAASRLRRFMETENNAQFLLRSVI